jgi:hypothetical protein
VRVFVGNNERGLISADGFQSNGTVGYILDTPRETSDSFASLVRSLGPSHVHALKQPTGSIHFLVGLCLHATSQKNDHRILLTNPLFSDTSLSADFVCAAQVNERSGTNVPPGGILADQFLLSTFVLLQGWTSG